MRTRLRNVLLGVMLAILLTSSIGLADLNEGLMAYYPFNGNTADETLNYSALSIYEAVPTSDRFGNPNSAYIFDGVDDYMDGPSYDVVNPSAQGSFAVSFWVRPTTTWTPKDNPNSFLVGNHIPGAYDWGITLCGTTNPDEGKFSFFWIDAWPVGQNGLPTTTETWSAGTWYHILVNYDSAPTKMNLSIWVNGIRENQMTITDDSGQNDAGNTLIIGSYPPHYADMSIDELRLYNRALSEDEIYELINSPPVANAGPDQTVELSSTIGTEIQLDGSASSDPDGDILTYDWTWWDEGLVSVSGMQPLVTLPPGMTVVTLTVSDGFESDADTVQITVEDTTPPQIQILAPEQYGLYSAGSLALDFSATDYSGISQLWGTLSDASEQEQEVSPGFIPDAGVYELVVSAIDGVGNRADSESILFVVYDSTAGFVTGGGWINSPVDARYEYMHVGGKATFGFVSKYKKGADVPTGNTEFQFKAGNLNFHSTSYDWLVVTGSDYARFKGIGTINGSGEYKFMLWAGDDDPDTFRIKIWLEEGEIENVVYDNGMDQPIGGGSVVIHTK